MEIDENKIKAFFKGKCNRKQAVVISRFLKKHPEIMDTLFDENDWLNINTDDVLRNVPYNETALLRKVKYHLKEKALVKKIQAKRWVKYAVAAGLLTICVFSIIRITVPDHRQEPVYAAELQPDINRSSDSIIWINNTGSTEKKTLSDGSEVLLSTGSSLRYKKQFDRKKRLLNLEGSAKFIVAKDADRPFTVTEGQVSTTALGTVFSVNKTTYSKLLSVHLMRGKVVVRNHADAGHQVFLLPGDACTYDGKVLLKIYAVSGGDNTYSIDKTFIHFKNTKLTDVFTAIENFYNATIMYKDIPDSVLVKSLYTGSFNRQKASAANVLRSVCDVNDLEFEETDQTHFRIWKNK